MKKFNGHWISSYKNKNFFLEYFISDFDIWFIFLTWVGFGLLGYVPNTLYSAFRLKATLVCKTD
jgi:hypothetical protein